MAAVLSKGCQSLTLEELQKLLPTSYHISSLEKAEVGKQKKDTIVIGQYFDVRYRKDKLTMKETAARLKLKEVLPNNNGLRFDVVIFGKTVDSVKEILSSNCGSPLWIGFSNLLVVNYTGQEEPWCPFGLKLEDTDTENIETNDSNSKPEITFFYQHSKPKELPTVYSPLNDTKNKKRINVFVVVTKILKQPVVLCNKTKHIMISLIDQSCLESLANYRDIPLHIFLNDTLDRFPEPFQRGDILRIRDMLGDLFVIENKMFGKIFHSKSVVKFKFSEEDDKVIPKTTNSTYVLTEQDEKKARELRQWWLKYLEKEDQANKYIDPLLLEKKICEITSPCTFNLNCLINDVRAIEVHGIVLLRVTDGTRSKVMTTFNFNDATQEFSSEAEQIENAVTDSEEIIVTIFPPLLEKASNLKAGDMVQLINVTCVDVIGDGNESSNPIIDFYMKDDECEIRNVLENSSISRQLLRSLSGKNSPCSDENGKRNCPVGINGFQENSRTKCDESKASISSLQLQGNVNPSSSITPGKSSSDNTIIEESLSPPSPSLLIETTGVLGRDIERSSSYPALAEKVDLSNSMTVDVPVCENDQSSRIGPESVVKSVPIGKGKLLNTKVKTTTESLSKPVILASESEVTSKAKRKLCHTQPSLSEPKNKINSYVWQVVEVDTICNTTFCKTSLTEFYNNSNPEDKGRVWAILKHIHISSNKPCENCQNVRCYHDWIWGLCISCGTTLSSADLRNHYSEIDLRTFETLPCFLCSSDSDPTAIIEPYYKLSLCLEDVNNDSCYSLDLCGDDAELFFGVKANFKWLVESVPASFHNQTTVFTRLNSYRPFQYCLINNSRNDDSRCIRICDTKLNF